MSLTREELALIGASLYICEGTKARPDKRKKGKNFSIELTNKDPRVISIFLEFLRRVVKAEERRIKLELFIYPDHSKRELEEYWSKKTKIPLNRFNKTITLTQKNSRYKPNPLGTAKIRYSHKEHFLRIQGIIENIFGA